MVERPAWPFKLRPTPDPEIEMATADLQAQNRDEIGEVEKYNFRTETKGVFKARQGNRR